MSFLSSWRAHILGMALLLLLVTWLGARDLNRDSLWYDEHWSIYDAGGAHFERRSPAQIWDGVAERNPWQAPGYFFALAGWGALVGWSEVAGRALSLFVGLLAISWTYRLGNAMGGRLVGLAAAMTLGTSAFFVHYLHELRGYTFYALFASLAVWAYWRVLNRRATRGVYIGLLAALIGLFYTHYFAALVVVLLAMIHFVLGVHVLLRRRVSASILRPRDWWLVTALMALSFLAFLPWLGVTLRATELISGDEIRQALAMSPSQIVQNLLYLFSSGSIALFAVIAFFALRARSRAMTLVWAWLFGVLALALLVNAWLAILAEDRYLMALYPALALVAGFGVFGLKRAGVPPALILGVWIIAGMWNSADPNFRNGKLHPPFWYLPWHELADAVQPHVQDGDTIIMHLPDVVWRWMHNPLAAYYVGQFPGDHAQMESLPGMTDADYTALERAYVDEARRVWFAYDPGQPPSRRTLFEQTLGDEGFTHCATPADTSEIHLDLYARVPPLAEAHERFGDGIGLTLVEHLPVRVSDTLTVLTGWTVASAVPPEVYSFGMHVTDAAGTLVTQFDAGLPPAGASCLPVVVNTGNLPPGVYTLNALVYNWQTGERLSAEGSGQTGDSVTLGTFTR